MFDDIRSDDGLRIDGHKRPRRSDRERPIADREVPLPPPSQRVLSPAVHAWLDGELPEAALRGADSETQRDVEFWNRLNEEAERRRRMRTPAFLEQRIMEAIPRTTPQLITPWWRREFVLTPAAALGAAAALVALVAAVTALLLVFAQR
jgi:hypothetical protein